MVASCWTAVKTSVGSEGFYSLRQGGPNDGFIDKNEKTQVYFHYYKDRKLDSNEITLDTANAQFYDYALDTSKNVF